MDSSVYFDPSKAIFYIYVHCAVTHVRNNNSHIQVRSPNVVYHTELLLKERIRYLWEQILSFKKNSDFEKERN